MSLWLLHRSIAIFDRMSEKIRRLSVVLLALALAAGLVTHGVRASDSGVKMAVAAVSDMPMPGECDGCGDDQKAMAAACSAFCGGVVALPSMGAAFAAVPAETLGSFVGPNPTARTVSPDPYPPRPAVLS
jgi:hypothetical protein